MIAAPLRELIRQQANFACEFCGVTEVDTGGLLTLDHFQPKSKGGADTVENLLYCCIRCNQYKQDYWPAHETQLYLWNPRQESRDRHFVESDAGYLAPLTETGQFTLSRLRLNRSALVAYRVAKQRREEEMRLLQRYRELVELLGENNGQLAKLVMEQQQLLEEQRILLSLILGKKE